MPRRRPKRASPVFMVQPYPLSDSQKRTLFELLKYPRADLERAATPGYRVLKREEGAPLLLVKDPEPIKLSKDPFFGMAVVEQALGLGVYGAEHLDNIPRPADYREVFKAADRDAIKLLKTITGWSGYYRDQFAVRGRSIHEIEQALAKLHDLCVEVGRDMAGKSSKGARKQTSLTEVVRRLRRIFKDCYQGQRTPRKGRGAFQSLALWENDELAFIKAALLAARLIPKTYPDLRRLIRDPRCALPDERGQTIERIAKKVQTARLREQKKGR